MEFAVEKFISNFVQNQFPLFYQEEGPDFILFMKAYYEWLESEGQAIYQGRRLFDYRDIDSTVEDFLEFFQKKYLYGIPFKIIANKRFLLKHILDVYRSKGTIQCYRLLFKLIYNEDIEVYLPGRDLLRVSDGTWVEPKYLEVTANQDLSGYIGKTIIGTTSKVTAVVENFVQENYNNDVINILYISNVTPKKKSFSVNEKIVLLEDAEDTIAINLAPTLLGSLDKIKVVNGGQDYNIGDVIKIVQRDISNNDVISYGIDGILKVTKLSRGFGSLNFDIKDGGFGYTADALTFVYKNSANGQGASFEIGTLISTQILGYNTDLVCDVANLSIDAVAYNLPANPTGNLSSTIGSLFTKTSNTFGTLFSLSDIKTGNGYDSAANVFVRSVQLSKPLEGSVSYDTTSNTVTGTSTIFEAIFANDDVIALQSNFFLSSTLEYAVIKEVVSNTQITLYGPPTLNSTGSAVYMAAPTILPSQYASYENGGFTSNGSIVGENEIVKAAPNTGNNVIEEAVALNSGKGYVEGEEIKAYLYSPISNNITIIAGGLNYSNTDQLIFVGGDPAVGANAEISSVDANGTITAVNVLNGGSGYRSLPEIRIKSANGSGALLTTTLREFNTTSEIIARVEKSGTGRAQGYWSTTRGFLDSDKYIQDSYYYQDYSYEIRVAQTLNKYKEIIKDTFHLAGSEIFGKYLKFLYASSPASVTFETSSSSSNATIYLYASEITTTADSTITVDKYYYTV
jgi:hypothetical protein